MSLKKRFVEPHERRYLSRLEAVKQLFHAFINRSQAYDYPNEIGLLLFGSETKLVCPLSPVFEDFRDKVDEAHTSGDTRLYDAIDSAAHHLEEWKRKKGSAVDPDVKLRILVLSDGADTKSTQLAWKVAARLQRSAVTLDAIMIGDERDRNLHCIAKASGGYVFAPESLADALRLNELEVLLSGKERAAPEHMPPVKGQMGLNAFSRFPADPCSVDRVPPKRPQPLLEARTRRLDGAMLEEDAARGTTPSASTGSPGQLRRVLGELRRLHQQPHPSIDVYPGEDITFWKLVVEGPEGTPYQGGVWLVSCQLPSEYPDVAPVIRFVTPIRHCNINAYGRVCHSIFDRNYTSDTTVLEILHCIYGLLLNPDYEDPLDSTLALEFYEASGVYEDSIRRHVEQHAHRSRAAWRQHLEDNDEEATVTAASIAARSATALVVLEQTMIL